MLPQSRAKRPAAKPKKPGSPAVSDRRCLGDTVTIVALVFLIVAVCFLACHPRAAKAVEPTPATGDAYQWAYSEAIRTQQPLIIAYGARWCGACQTLESDRELQTAIRQRGVYLHLDLDRDAAVIDRWRLPRPEMILRVYVWKHVSLPGKILLTTVAIRNFVFGGK